ncbi:MAG: hypothetical protein M1834_006209 [Cirrosporium novae-zelandiae]|nr:MAG: hypothetical protein M1834_006209 [Cirrosporium novae-zelandiae]
MTTEDDIYRTSTQYRLWSFTPESLASLRSSTNELAAEHVREAIKRARESHDTTAQAASPANGIDGEPIIGQDQENGDGSKEEIECLAVEEEQKLVGFYCQKCLELADAIPQPHGPLPTHVKATAVQYLKRFYLSNSPMTYHPKSLMPSALFLATKTENHYISLSKFSSFVRNSTPDTIIAPEFLLTQSLRFTFSVHHPFHGLEGGFMELTALANGDGFGLPNELESEKAEIQSQMLNLPIVGGGFKKRPRQTVTEVKTSVKTGCDRARETLKTSSVLGDAYFLFTPAQIWLAALAIHDKPLADFYLDAKLQVVSSSSSPAIQKTREALKTKLLRTLNKCTSLLQSYTGPVARGSPQMEELRNIDKKLYKCTNPEKKDIVSLNRAVKREKVDGVGREEKEAKRRRTEKEKDDLFGPSLTVQTK